MRLPKLRRDKRFVLEAKTAYGLLSTIVAIVKDDARTMRMPMWGGNPGNAGDYPPKDKPSCGTVGCIGGWVSHLTRCTRDADSAALALGFNIGMVEKDEEAIRDLFFGRLCDDENDGTPSHARKVIILIEKFQRKYRRRLLATPVTVQR